MNKKICSRKSSARQSARLGAYLAASLGASTAATSTADAAIVVIDIGPSGFNIGGVNAGLADNSYLERDDFPFVGAGKLQAFNGFYENFWGLAPGDPGEAGLVFASGTSTASPYKFSLGAIIDSAAPWNSVAGAQAAFGVFKFDNKFDPAFVSPDFGSGSYMGFRTAQSNYGWLEVTWNGASEEFQILSGAFEDVPGVAILAGDTGSAAIPEPGTWAAAALLAGGAAFLRWRKRRDEAQKEAA
jgi:hypothetical protein